MPWFDNQQFEWVCKPIDCTTLCVSDVLSLSYSHVCALAGLCRLPDFQHAVAYTQARQIAEIQHQVSSLRPVRRCTPPLLSINRLRTRKWLMSIREGHAITVDRRDATNSTSTLIRTKQRSVCPNPRPNTTEVTRLCVHSAQCVFAKICMHLNCRLRHSRLQLQLLQVQVRGRLDQQGE